MPSARVGRAKTCHGVCAEEGQEHENDHRHQEENDAARQAMHEAMNSHLILGRAGGVHHEGAGDEEEQRQEREQGEASARAFTAAQLHRDGAREQQHEQAKLEEIGDLQPAAGPSERALRTWRAACIRGSAALRVPTSRRARGRRPPPGRPLSIHFAIITQGFHVPHS